MRTRFRTKGIVALLLIGSPLWVQATDQTLAVSFECTAGNGDASTYEIWLYDNQHPPKPWDDAQAFAANRDLLGVAGHLATFQDEQEEACVLMQAAGLHLVANQQLWIGLVRDSMGAVPPGGWAWIGEPGNHYQNWAGGEPNNDGGNENHGTIGRFGYDLHGASGGHNDESPGRGTLYGFVVEYDLVAQVEVELDCMTEDCTIEIPSADPENNTIVLPIDDEEVTADVGVFLIEETCPATSHGVREVAFGSGGETIPVPNYLCADRWILISSDLADVEIESGVVEAQFDPADFGLAAFDCALNQPLPQVVPMETDLVTYLPESEIWGADGSFPRLDPFMQETAYACVNPSRGRMKGNQYFGVGLNFYFPSAMTPEDQINELISLTRRKLERLEEGIIDARHRRVISYWKARKLKRQVQFAIADIDHHRFNWARKRMGVYFPYILRRTHFNTNKANGFNFEGEFISRSSNAVFLLDAYIRPYFP